MTQQLLGLYSLRLVETLCKTMVKTMFEKVGIYGKCNHSLRATGISRMYSKEVPEKIIQEWSGHKSLIALRRYEHTSMEQQAAVSSLLSSTSSTSYKERVEKEETKTYKKTVIKDSKLEDKENTSILSNINPDRSLASLFSGTFSRKALRNSLVG